ncbi:MAG TPA: DUF4446 family protein [Candidatus Baltobacteraceae bacterium]|nr:DUF4446 family protein [Candidatus Baltobacteraceae bacterium]
MQPVIIAAASAFAGAVITLVLYHALFVKPALARMEGVLFAHDDLLGGGAVPATRRLSSLEEGNAALARAAERAESRLSELDARSRTDVSRIGFVRYDAFDDTGSELSYALALLNREGDGVVLSSIYSRTDTRTYGKAVEKFESRTNASAEELAAIDRARGTPAAT